MIVYLETLIKKSMNKMSLYEIFINYATIKNLHH